MSLRGKFEEKIKKKEQEIVEYEAKIREAKAYIQALQDSLKMVPRDDMRGALAESTLRPGSSIAKTHDFLKEIGKPMHITEILSGIGKGTSKKERTSLSGALGWYVRRKEIFTRPGPNVFGLLSMETQEENSEPPESFGLDR